MNSRQIREIPLSDVLHRGWDAGNYANAYLADNFQRAWDKTLTEMDSEERKVRHRCPDAFMAAFVRGYFSSYERSDIRSQRALDLVDKAEKDFGREMDAAGL